MLRDVLKDRNSTPTLLRKEFIQQLESLVSSDQDLAVGHYKGYCKLSICSLADIKEVWKNSLKGESITLWCNGPKQTKNQNDSESEEDALPHQKKHKRLSALDEKNRTVEKLSSSIQEKHGDKFTKILYICACCI